MMIMMNDNYNDNYDDDHSDDYDDNGDNYDNDSDQTHHDYDAKLFLWRIPWWTQTKNDHSLLTDYTILMTQNLP